MCIPASRSEFVGLNLKIFRFTPNKRIPPISQKQNDFTYYHPLPSIFFCKLVIYFMGFNDIFPQNTIKSHFAFYQNLKSHWAYPVHVASDPRGIEDKWMGLELDLHIKYIFTLNC